MRTILVFLAAISLLIPISAMGQSTLALQEKCAEGAKKFFLGLVDSYGGKWGFFDSEIWGRGYNDFTSHYNKKLDKCFILIEFHSFADKNKNAINIMDLWNVFENTRIGRLSTPIEIAPDCTVSDENCKSPSEFENLIRPYMEE